MDARVERSEPAMNSVEAREKPDSQPMCDASPDACLDPSSISMIEFSKPDPRSLALHLLDMKLLAIVLSIMAVVVDGSTWYFFDHHRWIWGLANILGIPCFLAFLWFVYRYCYWQHDAYRWRLSEAGLDIHQGVWFRSEINVPRYRVQHTDVQQGPLMRRFGVAKLVVHTAGTKEAFVTLEGISLETARHLRDVLLADKEVPADGT